MIKRFLFPFAYLTVSTLLGGCGIVLGLDEYSQTASSGTGEGGHGGGAAGGSGVGGANGMGGMGPCMPGMMRDCYTGPVGTQDVGMCKGGQQVCLNAGSYGACEGQVLPAAEDCATAGDEDCNGSSCSETNWARIFGDTAEQTGRVVAPDGAGGVFLAGSMDGTVKFDDSTLITGGGRDIFITRLGPDGAVMWAKRFGDASGQDPSAITVDAQGNVYLAAIVEGVVNFGGSDLPAGGYYDIAIASFDAMGSHRWSRRFGAAAAQEPHGLAITPTGELVVVGSFGGSFDIDSTTLTSKGDWDIFVAKLDSATGNAIWANQFGNTAMEQSDAVGVDSSGGIILVGRYGGYVNFGGTVLPIAGAMGDINVFVMKLDASGKHVWSNGYGDSDPLQTMRGMAVDKDGSVVFAGEFEGAVNFGGNVLTSQPSSRDIFVGKLTSTGMHVWSKQFGGNGDDWTPRVALNANGDVFLSCYFTQSIDFGGNTLLSDGSYDIAVARLSPNGAHVWSRRFGGVSGDLTQQRAADIALDPNERALFVTGSQMGVVDYGTGPLTTTGNVFDALVISIGP